VSEPPTTYKRAATFSPTAHPTLIWDHYFLPTTINTFNESSTGTIRALRPSMPESTTLAASKLAAHKRWGDWKLRLGRSSSNTLRGLNWPSYNRLGFLFSRTLFMRYLLLRLSTFASHSYYSLIIKIKILFLYNSKLIYTHFMSFRRVVNCFINNSKDLIWRSIIRLWIFYIWYLNWWGFLGVSK